jgi:hypothetical protein
MDWLKSKGKVWNGRLIPKREMGPAKPYKGECYDCGDPAPLRLAQCDDCHRRARKALEPMWPNQGGE